MLRHILDLLVVKHRLINGLHFPMLPWLVLSLNGCLNVIHRCEREERKKHKNDYESERNCVNDIM